jgi:hypothetical protein
MKYSRAWAVGAAGIGLVSIASLPACTTDVLVGDMKGATDGGVSDSPEVKGSDSARIPGDSQAPTSEGGASACASSTEGTVLATEATSGIFSIALDAANVYWTFIPTSASALGAVRSVTKSGGVAKTLASGEPEPQAIVVAKSRVYWGDLGGSSTMPSVRSEPSSGGTPEAFSPATPYTFAFVGLAADDANVYWGGANGAVLFEPLAGGAMTNLGAAGMSAFDVAVDADNIYWTGEFATEADPSGTWFVPKAGGAFQLLAAFDTSGIVPRIAADATGVYWSTPAGQVMRAPSVKSSPVTLATGQTVADLAVDGSSVYWSADSSIVKTPIGGGAITTLASHEEAMAIAVDDAFVYWANACGEIKKIAK